MRLGPEAVARLALPPLWTESIALRSGLFPGREELSAFLQECERHNWCARRPLQYHAGSAEEPAELLVTATVELLRAAAPDAVLVRAGHAALAALSRLSDAERAEAGRRLAPALDLLATSSVEGFGEFGRYSAGGVPPSHTSAGTGTPGRLRPDMPATELAAEATPLVGDLPGGALAELVRRCVEQAEVRSAARLLAAAARRLPGEEVRRLVEVLVARLPADDLSEQVALGHLATAAAIGDAVDRALELVQRLQSERLRARTLAGLAAMLVQRAGARPRVEQILQRLTRTVVQGSDVDLAAAADAVQQLTDAGAPGTAAPLVTLADRALENRTRRGSEVTALVRLASACARSGTGEQAGRFRTAALQAARAEGDPLVRAGALLQVLTDLPHETRPQVAQEALEAARGVVDTDDRAVLLARLVPHLQELVRTEALEELIGLCTPDDSRYMFWMPEAARKELLPLLDGLGSGLGRPRLADVARDVARRLVELSTVGAPERRERPGVPVVLPPTTRRWAVLASRLRPGDTTGTAVGDILLGQVESLLRSGATAEALRWVESARQLLPVVHGSYETSVLLAERRIEVEQRNQYDHRQLERFLERAEQVRAFEELLAARDDGAWALHYLGHGGVGKTTLLRFITAERAPRAGRVTARVDFDRLNPDFPLRRPGQLLLDLLTELEPFATGHLLHLYVTAREKLRHLEWWADEQDSRQDLALATERFCEYVSKLPRSVVMVLDTCEELTKYQPGGTSVPRLDAAFELLEKIHRRVPSLRVVLAGRRPLAASGPGWRIDSADLPAVPPVKDYLAVHEILGFTREEAIAYLTTVEDLPLDDPDVLDRLLARCVDPHEIAVIGGDPAGTRYSPFDLGLTAAAVRDDPHYAEVAPSEDVYVETRVRRRLGERWGGLLAVVTLLRRFDPDMLAAVVPPENLDDAWRELKATEWMTSAYDGALHRTFLEVDPGLQRRLEQYFRRPAHAAELERVRQGLGTALDRLVRATDLDELSIEAVEAALRTLDPGAAARLVECLTATVARDRAWMWAHTVFGRVLGAEGVLADPTAPARPGALLLYLTAASHMASATARTEEWLEVIRGAANHPDPVHGTWIRTVAALHVDPEDAEALAAGLSAVEQLLGAEPARATWLLGTCLSVLEMRASRTPDDELADRLVRTSEVLDRNGFHGVAALLLAEASSWVAEDGSRRLDLLRTAVRVVEQAAPAAEPASCVSADWTAPARAQERVRLQAVLAGVVGDRERWLSEALAASPPTDPDADRLAAALLDDWLGDAPVPVEILRAAAAALGERPPPAGGDRYAGVPPLRVALSRGWLAIGCGQKALHALGPRGRFATTAADQLALDLGRVDVARRLRLEEQDRRLRTSLCESRRPSEVPRVVEAVGLLDGRPPAPRRGADAADVHVLWRVSSTPSADLVQRVRYLAVAGARGEATTGPFERVASSLDADEARLVGDPSAPVRPITGERIDWQALAADVGQEQAARLLLRALAIEHLSPGERHEILERVLGGPRRPGPRRLAEWALEEGELLALRLTEPGAGLLRQAAVWFQDAGDPVGRLIATVGAELTAERGGRRPDLRAVDAALVAAQSVVPVLPSSVSALTRTGPTEVSGDWTGMLIRLTALARDSRLLRTETRTQRGYSSPELAVEGPRPGPMQEVAEVPSTVDSIRARAARPVGSPGRAAGPPTAAAGTASSGRGWVLIGVVVVVAVLLLVAAGAWLAYRGFSGAVSQQWPGAPTAVRVLSFVAVVAALCWVVVRIVTAGPTVNRLHVEVTGENDVLGIRASGFRKRRLLPTRHASAHVDLQLRGSGAGAWSSGGPPLAAQLRALAHPTAPLRVDVGSPPAAMGLPWESLLGEELRDLGPVRVHRSFIRSRNVRTSASPAPLSGRLAYAAPPEWVSLFQALRWDRVAEATGPVVVEPMTAAAPPGRGDIAVIVGVPIDSAVGPRLVVPSILLVEPDALKPEGSLVVVAGLPLPDRPESSTDAADMHDLRRCAADLVVAGADYAVVLPSLPATVLTHCLSTLTEALRPSARLSPRAVGAAVDAIRQGLRQFELAAELEVTELHAQG
ncbi:ATP-binding protein [Blastococcus sp. DSM 46786]|uniref:ATP-binding protein n=1 Tax=Blastococcus sp. DSM 46786 TaxID=1798227 RepID=UPI001113725C|nr:ATP-binding protein [Blastococcus sp. DSM 46786]